MELYIIAGPNGVGKTTFAREFLPNYADCKNFVNADLIAQAMAPFSPETAAIRAGKMMLSEIRSFAKKRVSFAFETPRAGQSYMGFLRRLKPQGYEVHLFFLWSRVWILHCRESKNESYEAGTMCPKRQSVGAMIVPFRIFWFI